jgi:G:T-mismatch repair DNA endonuclease (very short patch repair protein)
MPFPDLKTLTSGKTLSELYEQTLARIKQLKSAVYNVEVQWECEFEGADDLRTHLIVRNKPLNTLEALYGC